MPNDTTKPVQPPNANWRELCAKLGPLIGLLFVVVLFGVLSPKTFLTRGNAEIMLLQTAVVGTAALGMTLIIVAGGIDLSVGSNVALCTVVVALLLGAGASPLLAAAGGVATGMLCGLAIGALVAYGRMAPFVVTLGAWGALRGIAKGLARESIVMAPSTGLNNLLRSLRAGEHWRLLPTGVWLLLGCALAVAWMLRNLCLSLWGMARERGRQLRNRSHPT
jgi:ribose transport system permease protein